MNDEKWEDLIYKIEQKFGVEERGKEEDILEDDLGNVVQGEKEIIIFTNDLGKIKLERIKRPLIVDKKMHYHKGAGGTASVEFIVSDTEFTKTIKAYVFDESIDDWKQLDLPQENFKF